LSGLVREMLAALAEELDADPALAEMLAASLSPFLVDDSSTKGWLSASDAAGYLGLGSLDALDRAVIAGLPYAQPHGPGGRRYFERVQLDAWMRSGR
jgi:hypothetical protein